MGGGGSHPPKTFFINMFNPPNWFNRELKLIDKDYFAVWDSKIRRWVIRLWKLPHNKRDERSPSDIKRKSVPVLVVAERDNMSRDIGYHELDNRVLFSLKLRKRNSEIPTEKFLKMIDDANKEVEERADREIEDIVKDAANIGINAMKRIWSK